jgi:hypothetical protein
MPNKKPPEAIKVYYEKSKDYRLIPVTGAYGGLSPNGEVIIDFFVERRDSPKEITLEIDEHGKATEKGRAGQRFVRERQFGIVMRPDIAVTVGKFILDKANLATVGREVKGKVS